MHPVRGIAVTFTLTALALKGVTPGWGMGAEAWMGLVN